MISLNREQIIQKHKDEFRQELSEINAQQFYLNVNV